MDASINIADSFYCTVLIAYGRTLQKRKRTIAPWVDSIIHSAPWIYPRKILKIKSESVIRHSSAFQSLNSDASCFLYQLITTKGSSKGKYVFCQYFIFVLTHSSTWSRFLRGSIFSQTSEVHAINTVFAAFIARFRKNLNTLQDILDQRSMINVLQLTS